MARMAGPALDALSDIAVFQPVLGECPLKPSNQRRAEAPRGRSAEQDHTSRQARVHWGIPPNCYLNPFVLRPEFPVHRRHPNRAEGDRPPPIDGKSRTAIRTPLGSAERPWGASALRWVAQGKAVAAREACVVPTAPEHQLRDPLCFALFSDRLLVTSR